MTKKASEILNRIYRDCKVVGECLEVTSKPGNNGYPSIYVPEIGASGHAHRLVFFLINGFIPKGKCVMHKCDNRKCANGEHLLLGSNKLNLADMRKKGRGHPLPSGEKSHVAKFTDAQVETVRNSARDGVPYKLIARKMRMHPSHVSRVARGKSRATAPSAPIKRLRRKPISVGDTAKALALRQTGASQEAIAKRMRRSRTAIQRIVSRHMETKHPEKKSDVTAP